jgi:hypothetical protein
MLKTGRISTTLSALIVTFTLCSFAGLAVGQSQSENAPSVAEAARRAREQKKNTAKPNRTLTNDDIPSAPAGSSNTAGSQASTTTSAQPSASSTEAPANSANTAAPGNADTAQTTKTSENQTADQKKAVNAAALERAKKELAQALNELDVMQRKNVLDADSYYSKTDFGSDKGGKANLDAEQTQIGSKKEAAEKIKARVMELQELLGEPVTGEPDKTPEPH